MNTGVSASCGAHSTVIVLSMCQRLFSKVFNSSNTGGAEQLCRKRKNSEKRPKTSRFPAVFMCFCAKKGIILLFSVRLVFYHCGYDRHDCGCVHRDCDRLWADRNG